MKKIFYINSYIWLKIILFFLLLSPNIKKDESSSYNKYFKNGIKFKNYMLYINDLKNSKDKSNFVAVFWFPQLLTPLSVIIIYLIWMI